MKIKELIQTSTLPKDVGNTPPVLQSDDSIYQAFHKLAKSKANHLEVYENGVLLGTIPLVVLTEQLVNDYCEEREKRYRLITGLNYSLTKLKSLIKKINSKTDPAIRNELMEESEELINSLQNLLR